VLEGKRQIKGLAEEEVRGVIYYNPPHPSYIIREGG